MVLTSPNFRICIKDNLNVLESPHTVVIEGQMLISGLAEPNKVVQVVDPTHIDTLYGLGSVLSENLKLAFKQRETVNIYALPRADAKDGIRAKYELRFRGIATSNSVFRMFAGNHDYEILINISKGDTASDLVKQVVQAVSPAFPFSAKGIGLDTKYPGVEFTAKNAGAVGNVLKPLEFWEIQTHYIPVGITVSLNQTQIGKNDPVYTYDNIFNGCSYDAYVLCSPNLRWQNNLNAYINTFWDCSRGIQSGAHGYVYNVGELDDILESGTNSAHMSHMANHPNDHIFPYLKNTAFAVKSSEHLSRPSILNIAVEGSVYGVLESISSPVKCSGLWTREEMEILAENGFVVAEASLRNRPGYSSPVVYRDVTNYLTDELGEPNLTWRNATTERVIVFTEQLIYNVWKSKEGLPFATSNSSYSYGNTIAASTSKNDILASIVNELKEYSGILYDPIMFNVVRDYIKVSTESEVLGACQGDPSKIIITITLKLLNSINSIDLVISPKLTDCGDIR